jgi:folate-dependent phosphoribosylglycinamide formyltransferase PurN
MKILWIGGNHPRHLYFINAIQKDFNLSGAIIERREHMIPRPPEGIGELDRNNFIRHFENRDKAEKKYFGWQQLPDCPKLEVDQDNLNSARSVDFIKSIKPDLVLIFGSGLIKEPLLSALPHHTINLHLGISPRYRGAATLFWPFYFMEPGYAGSTFHYIISEADAGDVIHQVVPELHPEDGIHDVACKTVISSAQEALQLLKIFVSEGEWKRHKQKGSGKNFLSGDFKPEHLRVIYNLFNDDMVKHYLEGRLKSKTPSLIRQF